MDYQEIYEDLLEETALEATNGDVRFTCPYCGSTKRKFYVHTDTGVYTCYNCDEVGNIVTFLKTLYDYNYSEVLDLLKDWGYESEEHYVPQDKTLIEALIALKLEDNQKAKIDIPKDRTFPQMPSNSFPIRSGLLTDTMPYIRYLEKRGMTMRQIAYYNVYYCEKGELPTKEGKTIPISKSVIFITFNRRGQAIYWNTRSIEPNPYIKSINAPNLLPTDYSRREVIFNLNLLGVRPNVVICEGVFNALTVDSPNYCGVATFGKKVTDTQIQDLVDSGASNYYVFLDNDAPEAILSVATRLEDFGVAGSNIHVVFNPELGRDANNLGRTKALALVKEAPRFNLVTKLRLTQQIERK